MVKIEPTTRKRYTFAKHSGDILLDADPPTQDDALTNEDVMIIGPFQDFTGSKTINSRTQQMWGGHENALWGTIAHIEGMQDLDNLSPIGTSSSIFRRRRRKIYIKDP